MAADPVTLHPRGGGGGGAPTGPALRPIGEAERAPVMDALRGFAVLGILAMNIPGFAFPEHDFWDPRVGGFTGLDRAAWYVNRLVFDMKMQSLFSMLFGAGLVVLGERAAAAGRSLTPLFFRRLGILALMGLLHAYLLWYGDILWTYAVCGALVYPLRRLRTRWLLAIGIALFLIGAVSASAFGGLFWLVRDQADRAEAIIQSGGTPGPMQEEMLKAWQQMRADFVPDAERLAREAAAHRGGFLDIVRYRAPGALAFQLQIFFMFSLWRFAGYMLIGIALMRRGVFSGRLPPRAYALMAILGYAIGLPIVWLGARQAEAHGFDFVMTWLTGWQWNYVGSAFVAFGHVGALTLVFRSGAFAWLMRALAAAGRLALTNYLTQSLLCNLVFFGWALGCWNRLSRLEVACVTIGIWALQIAWSLAWLSRFRLGPLEWLWRGLTYGAWPPMRRDRAPE